MAGANSAYGSFSSGRKPGTGKEKQKTAPDWDEVLSETSKGLATTMASALRGATKATVGGPGDLIELVNQLRQRPDADTLLPTSKEVGSVLPEVPGGSESYEELGSYLDPKALAKKGGVSLAALYAGALRKDLHMAHTTDARNLLTKGEELPRELTNMSMGIAKDRLPDFGGANLQLIPQLGKFDPKRAPTSLTAIDGYTPRRDMAQGSHIDEIKKDLQRIRTDSLDSMWFGDKPERVVNLLKDEANKRLADRLISSYPPGGVYAEGLGSGQPYIPARSIPQFGKGKSFAHDIQPMGGKRDLQRQSTIDRFRSFKHFEESPRGAARLASPYEISVGETGAEINETMEKVRDFAYKLPEDPGIKDWLATLPSDDAYAAKLELAAQGYYDKDKQVLAHLLIKKLRNTPSEYAELKAWGQTQLNPENFAGAILTPEHGMSDVQVAALRSRFEKRGIPFELADPRGKWFQDYEAPHEIANRLQGQPRLIPQRKVDLPPGKNVEELLNPKPITSESLMGKKLEDLTNEELSWLIENDSGHPIFDQEIK